MSEKDDVAAWNERLVAAAKRGTIVDLRTGVPARQYDPATADQWPVDRNIPARAIREVLIGAHTDFDPRGLRIIGARITGDIDFAHITFGFPLELIRCRIDRPMNLSNVSVRQLTISGSHLPSLSLDGAHITGGLFADRITTHGDIDANDATITGQLILNDAQLHNPGQPVLTLDGAIISGELFADRITTHGDIRALCATIRGQLILNDAQLYNPGQPVLTLDSATITGELVAERITTHGEVRAPGATIGGQLILDDAQLHNPGQPVLTLDQATVTGGLFADRITTDGEVRASGATSSGQLSFNGAHLSNPGQPALTLDQATVTGGLFADRITINGEVRAPGAAIGSQLRFNDAHLSNPGQPALNLDGATITSGLLADRITTHGEISATTATIGGQLKFNGAHLSNPGQPALTLDQATVTGGLLARDNTANCGVISAFRAEGRISARRARFENHLDLRDAKPQPCGTGHLPINLDGAVIRELTLPTDRHIAIDLSRTKITYLNTPNDQEPQYPVDATGWEIGDVHGHIRTNHAAATRWLAHRQGTEPSRVRCTHCYLCATG
ncbi:hypothetical protein [Rhodococcus jostii]|uniref:hypothetical protein n=1 Tax=Rhodococcus jostii TaxID=132919 RepID=UPI0036603F20